MDTPIESVPQPTAPIPLPENALVPQMGQVPPPPPAKKSFPISKSLIIAIIVAAGLIIGGIVGLSAITSQNLAVVPTPTPQQITPTPTPVRTLSAVAGQTEFMQFEAAKATLSARIASY